MLKRVVAKVNALLTWPFLLLIYFYRLFLSPLLGQRCRYYPSCSEYAILALKSFSLPFALWLISKRLLKCHPYGKGGFDPLPKCK